MNDPSKGIQVYGIRAESVSFELTITFQADTTTKAAVTGFDATDILLYAADSSNKIIPGSATASVVRSNTERSVYTTTVTVKGNINKVIIQVPQDAANALPTIGDDNVLEQGAGTSSAEQLVVNIIRSAAPPLTLSANKLIGGNAPFKVTLTSTQAI